MSDRELTEGLASMSPTAIDRFRRMRRLSTDHTHALDTFLRQNPEKRLTAETSKTAPAKSIKAKTKSPSKPKSPAQTAKTDDDGYVQLWMRMRAWWDGVEVAQPGSGAAAETSKKQMAIKVDVADDTNYRWEITQQLWGEANVLPGGKTFSLDLLKSAKPTKNMAIADLTSGLGGGTRHIARETGAAVDAFEVDKELVEEGQRLCKQGPQPCEISISPMDIQKIDAALDKDHYDIIVARDFLYARQDRKDVLAALVDTLKTGGSLVFTDFCLADRATEKKDLLAWRQAEPQKPSPGTVDEYRELLTSLRFDLKSAEDITSSYAATIQIGWKSIVESLKTGVHSRGYVDSLMQEGQIWLARSRALESGQLRAIKFHATMQKGPKRSLTDSMSLD